jgi:hypothetical protein
MEFRHHFFEAASEDALKQTHGRHFETLRELVTADRIVLSEDVKLRIRE